MVRILPALFLAIIILVVLSCGDDETTAPPTTISVTSYINRIYDGDYVVGQQLPSSTLDSQVTITEADSIVGQGGTFLLTVHHETGVADLLIGAEGAVGYFVLPVDADSTRTVVGGYLTTANQQDFTFVVFARKTGGEVMRPGMHGVRVINSRLVKFYISGVQGAEYVEAELPTPTKGQTIVNVEGDDFIINGGSNEVTLSVIVPAQDIIIGVDNAFGYFRLPTQGLPGDIALVVFIAQSAPSTFSTVFMSEEPGPEYGTEAIARPTLIRVGGGDLQVSLAFFPSHDLDLHLVEPSGEEIYYGHRESAAGGELDRDSNPACNLDDINNENITYEEGSPLSGEYIVRVDFWESCDGTGAEFRVITSVKGQTELYRGTFQASEADGGGAGSGREICRFIY